MNSDDIEAQVTEALDRMAATDLGGDQGADISRTIRRLVQRQADVQQQLKTVVSELDEVAALLRQHTALSRPGATDAREHIAGDFSDGAQAVEAARQALLEASEKLEYQRYQLL